MTTHRNREQVGVYAGLLITAFGIALLIDPSLIEMDMLSGGYALRFVGMFVLLIGLLVTWMWRARAMVMAQLLAGENLLAHWTYPVAQAQQHAARTFAEAREQNRGLFIITTILIFLIGIPVLVIPMWHELYVWPQPLAWTIILVYFALIPLLGLFAWGMPRLAYRRALQDGGDAYIARDGLFVNGALYTWQRPLSYLKGVRFYRDGKQPALEFDISNLTRLGILHYATSTVRVPVPRGQEEQAENVAQFFVKGSERMKLNAENTQ